MFYLNNVGCGQKLNALDEIRRCMGGLERGEGSGAPLFRPFVLNFLPTVLRPKTVL